MPKHGGDGGAGRSCYVLVLREHDEPGSGYSLELAPLAASDAPPRTTCRGSTREDEDEDAAAAATATATGTATRVRGSGQAREEAGSGAASRAQRLTSPRDRASVARGPRAPGSGQAREEAGSGAPSRARRLTSSRDTASVPGKASRARGATDEDEEAAGRPPRSRGSRARGAVDVAAGGPRGGDGESGGRDVAVEVYDDIAGDEGDRILREMRDLIFSPPQDLAITDDANENLKVPERQREVLIPVFLSPKKKGKNNKDDIWNKRQIMYGVALLGLLGFVPPIVAFLPQWALCVFAAIWGLSSIGFPFGLYGTSKLESGYSRHMGRFVFMGFCLVVIFMLYQYMALTGNSPQPQAISPPPSAATNSSARIETKWTVAFAVVGVIVMAGHIFSWARGCFTGSDDDEESESSGTEDIRASDLVERLLERH